MTADTQAPVPIRLSRANDGALEIGWSDGRHQRITVVDLQKNCPCATCREKRKATVASAADPGKGPSLNILKSQPVEQLSIMRMAPVGNYAYSVEFNQGCGKGIYTFELLRRLGQLSATD